jgi:hypothetical protein
MVYVCGRGVCACVCLRVCGCAPACLCVCVCVCVWDRGFTRAANSVSVVWEIGAIVVWKALLTSRTDSVYLCVCVCVCVCVCMCVCVCGCVYLSMCVRMSLDGVSLRVIVCTSRSRITAQSLIALKKVTVLVLQSNGFGVTKCYKIPRGPELRRSRS